VAVKERERESTRYEYVLRLPPEVGRALRAQAEEEDRPISRVILRALLTYLSSPGRVMDPGTV
jgi:hypothetical protein